MDKGVKSCHEALVASHFSAAILEKYILSFFPIFNDESDDEDDDDEDDIVTLLPSRFTVNSTGEPDDTGISIEPISLPFSSSTAWINTELLLYVSPKPLAGISGISGISLPVLEVWASPARELRLMTILYAPSSTEDGTTSFSSEHATMNMEANAIKTYFIFIVLHF